jgi:hypothetical protein
MRPAGDESVEILCEVHDGNDGSKPDAIINSLIHDLSHAMVVHRPRHICGHNQTSGPDQKVAEYYFSRVRNNVHQPVEAHPVGTNYVDAGVYHSQEDKKHDARKWLRVMARALFTW